MRAHVDRARLHAFMRALAQVARRPLQVYFVGGATAVLEGWRHSTIDVDLRLNGDDADAVLRATGRPFWPADLNPAVPRYAGPPLASERARGEPA